MAVGGYDGMALIYEALKKTNGSTDGEKLVAAMKVMKLTSRRDPIMIDPETRDVVQAVYIRKVEKTGGGLYNVECDKFPTRRTRQIGRLRLHLFRIRSSPDCEPKQTCSRLLTTNTSAKLGSARWRLTICGLLLDLTFAKIPFEFPICMQHAIRTLRISERICTWQQAFYIHTGT